MSHPTTELIDDRDIEFLRFSPYYINQHQLLVLLIIGTEGRAAKKFLQGYNPRRACEWPQPMGG